MRLSAKGANGGFAIDLSVLVPYWPEIEITRT